MVKSPGLVEEVARLLPQLCVEEALQLLGQVLDVSDNLPGLSLGVIDRPLDASRQTVEPTKYGRNDRIASTPKKAIRACPVRTSESIAIDEFAPLVVERIVERLQRHECVPLEYLQGSTADGQRTCVSREKACAGRSIDHLGAGPIILAVNRVQLVVHGRDLLAGVGIKDVS